MKTITKSCQQCSKLFQAPLVEHKRGHAKFCSQSCGTIACNTRRFAGNKPNCTCAQCGKEFYRSVSKQKNSKSGLQFCSRECKDLAQRIGGIKEIMPPHYGKSLRDYRSLAFQNLPNECCRCGYNIHFAALVVHHKDSNRSNNTLENLEILCANCHAIEHWG